MLATGNAFYILKSPRPHRAPSSAGEVPFKNIYTLGERIIVIVWRVLLNAVYSNKKYIMNEYEWMNEVWDAGINSMQPIIPDREAFLHITLSL